MTSRLFKLLSNGFALLVIGWTGSTSAALLPPVTVSGQEWLQPLDFVNQSWNDIASVCDTSTGVCNGSLGGNDLTGWTWAGIPELNSLLTSFGIPGFTGGAPGFTVDVTASSTWAPNFLASFLATSGSNQVAGILRNFYVPSPVDQPVVGLVTDNGFSVILNLAFDGAATASTLGNIDTQDPTTGGWFYREIPLPATLPLLGLGLAALGYSGRKRK